MLKVCGLVKNYGSFRALDDISFEVKKGSVFGFLGRNGAGKTTTMNILAGLMEYDSGEIFIDGRPLAQQRGFLEKKMGYLPEEPVFYGYMSAYEYLRFVADIAGMNYTDAKKRIDEVLGITGLSQAASRKIKGYSRGMKQRLGLAVALLNKPALLLLDEPASALDPEGRRDVLKLIENLKGEGVTVFLSTHILSDVERVCDEVSIIEKGRVVLSDSIESLRSKYIQPVYDVELDGEYPNFVDMLKKREWVQNVRKEGRKLAVYFRDLEKAKLELPALISEIGAGIVSLQLRRSTLEDVFMRMVNTDANI